MAWLWFWWTIGSMMIVMDAIWWGVSMRLAKRKLWRVLISIFIASQLIVHLLLMSRVVSAIQLPKAVLVAVVVWHFFALALGLAVLSVLGIARVCAWLVRMIGLRRKQPAAAPASANSMSRREFIGAAAALAPPLFTLGLTGVSLAQLNTFRVRRFTLPIKTLPRALDGITIAHVSDMHVGRYTRGQVLREMVRTTNSLQPDLVLVTGDLIDYSLDDLAEGISLVNAMEGRYGRWMIEGNHDLLDDAGVFERRVKASGVPLLLDESAVIDVRGHPVQLFGLSWLGTGTGHNQQRDEAMALQMHQLMKQRQVDAFPILLAHHPHAFDAAIKADLPLTLAGHTHGGYAMLDSQHGLGPALFRYWSGLYTQGNSQLIVSNGVGNMFPIRINAPAEIIHITLHSA
jgi:predicted MPP superfamily phosphohydrolase